MKILLFVTFVIALLVSCGEQDTRSKELSKLAKDTTGYTSIQWIDSLKNIGTVEAGKKQEISFRFKNTGTKSLFIISAEPGCGCTVAAFPKEPVQPGSEGVITAEYQAPGDTNGEFRKNIEVTTNTKGVTSHFIYFFGVLVHPTDSASKQTVDRAALQQIQLKELKRNPLLNPVKN